MAGRGPVLDRERVRAFLDGDRPWAARPLCSLDRDEWPYVRCWLDTSAGVAIWVLQHPWWGAAAQAFGTGPALAALASGAELPRRTFLKLVPQARAAMSQRYDLKELEPIVRMHVTPDTLRLPDEASQAEPLGAGNGPELADLYAGWPAARFHLGRLRRGYRYWGIRRRGELVAVAENALRSREQGVAIVQGVYVAPSWRSRGLARAVTGALTASLFADGIRDVVLDVRAENVPALAAYERLGYRRHVDFLGGAATRR